MNSATGAIVILAYPEEFVRMIPAWYRKPMEWTGMVNHDKIAAGHSAMALIEKKTGNIHYGDFGRYVAELGNGRTRMAHTDPDVIFDYKVKFDANGNVIDQNALFDLFYNAPDKTHGGPVMYISINLNVDFEACFDFMSTMNKKGSIIYDPFGEGNSNCSRFVYDALQVGINDKSIKKRLKRKSPITSSPLGNVFHGTDEPSFKYSKDGIEEVEDKSLILVIKHLFKKYENEVEPSVQEIPSPWSEQDHVKYLDGIGDQSYIKLDEIKALTLLVSKYGADKKLTYTREYTRHPNFDPSVSFEFIHDCNAAWITISQNGQVLRMDSTVIG